MVLSLKGKFSLDIKRYWEIQFAPDYTRTEEQWKEEILSCLSDVVKIHMISDVPLGAFLSGGIDSSCVVAMMAQNSNLPIKTFSIGFKEKAFNELEYAREIAQKYGCEHHEQIVEPESIDLLPKLVHAYDEPFADSSAIPTYYVSKLAREFVTVALSGDGGDELFAGYDSYANFLKLYSYRFNFEIPFFNKLIWGTIHKLIPGNIKGKLGVYYLSKNKYHMGAYANLWTKDERLKLIPNRHNNINYSLASELYKTRILDNGYKNDFITNLQNLDLHTYLVDDILTKVDRASMMNSLEVRVPFLDHKFAELSFKIPFQLKLRNNDQKYILKKAMGALLPPNILNHPKQGFSVPLSLWFREDLKNYVGDTLLSKNALLSGYLDMKYIKRIVEKNHKKKRPFSGHIWSLLFFEEWLKQNI